MPFSVSVGVLADIWHTEERGFANGVFTLGAVLGTVSIRRSDSFILLTW